MLRHLLVDHFRKLTKFRYKFGCRLKLQLPLKKLTSLRARLDWAYCAYAFWVSHFPFFFVFFFFQSVWTVTALFTQMDSLYRGQNALFTGPTTTLFWKKKIIKMGPTALFTHLKIILLQCFQFSVFSKISCIWTDPTYFENLTIHYMFFIFLAHMSGFVIIEYYLLYDAKTYF